MAGSGSALKALPSLVVPKATTNPYTYNPNYTNEYKPTSYDSLAQYGGIGTNTLNPKAPLPQNDTGSFGYQNYTQPSTQTSTNNIPATDQSLANAMYSGQLKTGGYGSSNDLTAFKDGGVNAATMDGTNYGNTNNSIWGAGGALETGGGKFLGMDQGTMQGIGGLAGALGTGMDIYNKFWGPQADYTKAATENAKIQAATNAQLLKEHTDFRNGLVQSGLTNTK